MNEVVQSLWIGERLTTMERLAISSFLKCGHTFHLYCYKPIENVPPGTTVMDGNDIYPADAIFTYRTGFNEGSPAAFSNLFRYKLLLERGGWWVDLDVVCLRRFAFSDARVLASEHIDYPPQYMVGSAVIKVPAGDALMKWVLRACEQKNLTDVKFGDLGPNLMQMGLDVLDYHSFLRPHTFFCPVPYHQWRALLDPGQGLTFGPAVYAIHLWNAMWRDAGVDKNARFPDGCLYEALKQRYLTS